ncbi:hypothetical protein CR513_54326, partial [Mucuna pruriens]
MEIGTRSQWRRAFERKHGNLLNILDIKVQPTALEVLAQYYDVPLRCFTFRDFQLAPTLEEYKHLLELPLWGSPYYFHRGQSPSWRSIAKLLRVTKTKMVREKKNRNGLEGIQKSYLEERLYQFREDGDWPAFMDAYGLLVYEIVLFPHGDDFVDLIVADAYLAKRDGDENPTMALLANTYYTLNHCCERKGENLRCCIPLLYLWMTAHLFHSRLKTACPIEEFKWCWIKTMIRDLWARQLDQATERTICWYPMWNEKEEIIQAGYPAIKVPSVEAMTSFVIQGPEAHSGESHRKIRHAWKNARVGLPQGESQHRDKEVHIYEVHETLRVRELEENLAQKEAKQNSLKRKLEEVVTALASAEQEVSRERQLSDQVSKRARVEEKDRIKIGSCLKAADQEMCLQRAQRDRLKEALSAIKEREAEREAQLLRLQEKTHPLEEELTRAKLSKEYLIYQRRESIFELIKARTKVEEAEAHFQATIQELRSTLETWKERRVIAPRHRYRTKSQAKDMEDAIESLEQQNQELKGEIGQLREQMSKLFELFTQGAARNIAGAQGAQGPDRASVENPGVGESRASYQSPQDPNRVRQAMLGSIPSSNEKISSLEERVRAEEGTGNHGLDVTDLCLVPDIILPTDFKVPKFEKYKGSSCPRTHLAMYCRKMVSFIHQDKILVHCFQDSLTGAALSWYVNLESGRIKKWRELAETFVRQYKYNEDMAVDHSRLQNLSKANSKGFKDYAQRWRELAAQVQPPLSEKKMITMFINTLPSPFYDKAVGSVATNFADLVTVGERIEFDIKRGKFAQTSTNNGFAKKAGYEKKKGEANAILIDLAS